MTAPAPASAYPWRFVTPLFVGAALNPVNSSIIATALVPIARGLHVPAGRVTILVSGLYLASAIAQPTAGKLAEEFGPRRVFQTGILLVLLGGIIGGTGHDLTTLTAARILIGIGTSAGYPSAMVLIRRRATEAGMGAPPGGVLGGLAIAGMVTAAIGPPIGGLLVGAFGWHSAFLVNIPITLVALVMVVFWVPRDPPAGPRDVRRIVARLDVAGIAGFGATMAALLVFLMALPRFDLVALVAVVVFAVPMVWWELRAATPFFDIRRLARDGALTRTYLRTALTLLGAYAIMYGLTQWLEGGRGMSSEQAGLFLLPMGALSALVSGPLSRRNLVRGPLVAAAVSMLAGSVGILFVSAHSPAILLVAVTLVFGLSMGAATVGNQTALYTQAPPEQIGTASGLFRTFSYIGSIASAAVTGIAFKDQVTDHGLHTLAVVLVVAGAVVLVMTLLDRGLGSGAGPAEGRRPEVEAGRRTGVPRS